MALLAFEALFILLPVVMLASALGAYNSFFFYILLLLHLTCFFIGKQNVKFNIIHNLSLFDHAKIGNWCATLRYIQAF